MRIPLPLCVRYTGRIFGSSSLSSSSLSLSSRSASKLLVAVERACEATKAAIAARRSPPCAAAVQKMTKAAWVSRRPGGTTSAHAAGTWQQSTRERCDGEGSWPRTRQQPARLFDRQVRDLHKAPQRSLRVERRVDLAELGHERVHHGALIGPAEPSSDRRRRRLPLRKARGKGQAAAAASRSAASRSAARGADRRRAAPSVHRGSSPCLLQTLRAFSAFSATPLTDRRCLRAWETRHAPICERCFLSPILHLGAA